MSRILITSGPTRQYLDPVRYLSNASSGLGDGSRGRRHCRRTPSGCGQRAGRSAYPTDAEVVPVVSTDDMLAACLKVFPACDGLIAAAAPCDYRPAAVAPHKIRKTGEALHVELVETPDVVAALAEIKISQWMVAFALETEDHHMRACKSSMQELRPDRGQRPAVDPSADTQVEIALRRRAGGGPFRRQQRRRRPRHLGRDPASLDSALMRPIDCG